MRGETVLAQRAPDQDAVAAEVILPAVEAVLEEARILLADVALFAVAIGPGSFTGLRVGLATVKGLAFAVERPVAAVPTLEALCLAAGSDAGPVATLLDARRGEVYAACFGPGAEGGGDLNLVPEGLYTPASLATRLPPGCRFAGDGALLHAAALSDLGFPVAAAVTLGAAASAVGRIGQRLFAQGLARPAADLVPRYLRRAEAEARRTGEPLETEKPF